MKREAAEEGVQEWYADAGTAGLIVLGSDLAFESIISGGGVTLQIGYVTPVIVVRPLPATTPLSR